MSNSHSQAGGPGTGSRELKKIGADGSALRLDPFGLDHANLQQKAGEIVDAALVRDLPVRELVEKDGGYRKPLSGRRKTQEFANMGTVERKNTYHIVAVDDELVDDHGQIQEGREDGSERLLGGIRTRVHAGSRAFDDSFLGVITGQRGCVEIFIRLF